MKRTFAFITLYAFILIMACSKKNSDVATVNPTSSASNSGQASSYPYLGNARFSIVDSLHSQYIPMDSANKMISSYLTSINTTHNDSDLHSISINADSLRKYLLNVQVTNIKLIFAHTMGYIRAGHYGEKAGYQSNALTIIIAGYDQNNNYVYYNGSSVLDHGLPCPASCPVTGSAGFDLLY